MVRNAPTIRKQGLPRAAKRTTREVRVLFVCMGNICRSPTAEAVLRKALKEHGIDDRVEVDSAGTHGYHVGEPPDPRTQRAAESRGYDLSSIRNIGQETFKVPRFMRIECETSGVMSHIPPSRTYRDA